jgi:hypothetical protein
MQLKLIALLVSVLALNASAETSVPSSSLTANNLPAVDHYVYLSELPLGDDLIKDAASNGLTVTRLDRTADRLVVTYRYPDGSTGTVGYALLGAAGVDDRVTYRTSSEPRTVVEERTVIRDPEIVYVEPRYRTRYYDRSDDFWLPLTLGIGLGWATTWNSGHDHHYYRGGHHSGYRGSYHGGYRGTHHRGGGHHSGGRRR